jgi:hypothetical protein
VTVPYSWPSSRTSEARPGSISLGNGPAPTRVTYAFETPITSSIRVGPIPMPVAAAPATGFEEVTNGYVPWSRSSSVPCAPSSRTRSPRRSASSTSSDVSATYGRSRCANASFVAATSSSSNGSCSYTRSSQRFFSTSAVSIFWRRIFGSSRSCTRIPSRAALSAYAGPIPRRVVPICSFPSRRSLAPSIAMCHGMIRCALPEIRSGAAETPRDSSPSTSSSSTSGSTTQPAPSTLVLPERIPEGRWRNLNVSPSTTIVCPAFGPPW